MFRRILINRKFVVFSLLKLCSCDFLADLLMIIIVGFEIDWRLVTTTMVVVEEEEEVALLYLAGLRLEIRNR